VKEIPNHFKGSDKPTRRKKLSAAPELTFAGPAMVSIA
jgi:hypothetical protein